MFLLENLLHKIFQNNFFQFTVLLKLTGGIKLMLNESIVFLLQSSSHQSEDLGNWTTEIVNASNGDIIQTFTVELSSQFITHSVIATDKGALTNLMVRMTSSQLIERELVLQFADD